MVVLCLVYEALDLDSIGTKGFLAIGSDRGHERGTIRATIRRDQHIARCGKSMGSTAVSKLPRYPALSFDIRYTSGTIRMVYPSNP